MITANKQRFSGCLSTRCGIAVCLAVLCLCQDSISADYALHTSVAAIYERNDNILLSAKDELSDSIWTIAPFLKFTRQSERLTLRADGKLEFYRYREYDAYDDMDQWYNAKIEATPAERLWMSAKMHISDDNRPDRDIETTGLVMNNVRRKRVNADTSAFYTFTEHLSGGLSLIFNRENFDDPEVSDRKDYHAMLSATMPLESWLSRSTGRMNLGFSHYEFEREYETIEEHNDYQVSSVFEDITEVNNFSLTIGSETAVTERMELFVDIGGRYSISQRESRLSRSFEPPFIVETPSTTDEDSDNYGFVGKVDFIYRGERYKTSLLLSHDLEPVSGENSTANRTTVKVSVEIRLLEQLRGNCFSRWYRNQNDQDDPTQDDIHTHTWNNMIGLRWEITDHFDLAGEYTYTIFDDRESGSTTYRNKVIVQLEAHHDWLE